ncbi:choice-of-anchor Q domain-containing protein [Dokdonella ginsengisoli]|uniref:Choice-of-anchor Q domain-containing protein n=1 Tax=Dokdonella ginsengisoli TaxID=363846 RepID=A0ABV9QXZ7_9GAMM
MLARRVNPVHPRTTPLARSLALACGLACTANALAATPEPHGGANIVVQNCDDDGSGSLREAVRDLAVSGDTIDLRSLSCSTITLTSGAIAVDLDDLTVLGPPRRIAVSGHRQSPVVVHLGHGTLAFHDVAITAGRRYVEDAPARGGCLYSQGDVLLDDVTLSDCVAGSPQAAAGGGLFVAGDLVLLNSVVTGAQAITGSGGASGGGARVGGHLTAKYSAFTYNSTGATEASGVSTCGAAAAANATLVGSSIVGNSAAYFGGLCAEDANASAPLRVSNSTIADNLSRGTAPSTGGTGLDARGALTVSNSTIAHNLQAAAGDGVGLYARTGASIESSIVAGNASDSGAQPADLAGGPGASVAGSHNLIRASTLPLPPDTLDADPRLRAVAVFPGGRPTAYVRAPREDSPAIDAGSNPLGLVYDQRGAPNVRVSGPAADIGAVELDHDTIFADGFDVDG